MKRTFILIVAVLTFGVCAFGLTNRAYADLCELLRQISTGQVTSDENPGSVKVLLGVLRVPWIRRGARNLVARLDAIEAKYPSRYNEGYLREMYETLRDVVKFFKKDDRVIAEVAALITELQKINKPFHRSGLQQEFDDFAMTQNNRWSLIRAKIKANGSDRRQRLRRNIAAEERDVLVFFAGADPADPLDFNSILKKARSLSQSAVQLDQVRAGKIFNYVRRRLIANGQQQRQVLTEAEINLAKSVMQMGATTPEEDIQAELDELWTYARDEGEFIRKLLGRVVEDPQRFSPLVAGVTKDTTASVGPERLSIRIPVMRTFITLEGETVGNTFKVTDSEAIVRFAGVAHGQQANCLAGCHSFPDESTVQTIYPLTFDIPAAEARQLTLDFSEFRDHEF